MARGAESAARAQTSSTGRNSAKERTSSKTLTAPAAPATDTQMSSAQKKQRGSESSGLAQDIVRPHPHSRHPCPPALHVVTVRARALPAGKDRLARSHARPPVVLSSLRAEETQCILALGARVAPASNWRARRQERGA